MLDHHLQRAIVYQLAFTQAARFSELKPDDIESKLFTYHLKKVMAAGYVEKSDDGLYALTISGRRLGLQVARSESYTLEKAYSVLFLLVRRKSDRAWLLYTRGVHPLFGHTAFTVGTPDASLTAAEVAQRDLKEKTGIDGTFTPLGAGFYHVYRGGELESYTNFTLMVCEDAVGELQPKDQTGKYEWGENPEFSSASFLPDAQRLVELYEKGEPFFVEESFDI